MVDGAAAGWVSNCCGQTYILYIIEKPCPVSPLAVANPTRRGSSLGGGQPWMVVPLRRNLSSYGIVALSAGAEAGFPRLVTPVPRQEEVCVAIGDSAPVAGESVPCHQWHGRPSRRLRAFPPVAKTGFWEQLCGAPRING